VGLPLNQAAVKSESSSPGVTFKARDAHCHPEGIDRRTPRRRPRRRHPRAPPPGRPGSAHPRLEILALERLADRDGKSVDAVLARELLDVVSAHSEYLAAAIPDFTAALRWPQ
jgi:hypothetical protein